MPEEVASPVTSSLQSQLEFARHSFDSQQRAIRLLDSKAGIFISLLVFLANGMAYTMRDASTKLHWTGRGAVFTWLYLGSLLVFLSGFVVTAWCVQRVVRPRTSPTTTLAGGLLYARAIVSFRRPQAYHDAVKNASEESLLEDVTVQTYNLSVIVERKTEALRTAWRPTLLCFLAWAINIVVAIGVLSRH
jgi:hypothetical protein